MFKLSHSAVLIAALSTAPLIAAVPAGAQVATTFTGPRVEATLGFDQLQFDLGDLGGTGRGRATDLQWGGAAGYDVALSPTVVVGVEAGASFGDGTARRGGTNNGGSLRRRREVDVAARLGTTVGGSTLLYGKVGYTNLQIRADRTVAGTTTANLRDLDGLLLAAGVEVKVSPRLYLKSEYRHTDYSYDYDGNAVVTGLGLRF